MNPSCTDCLHDSDSARVDLNAGFTYTFVSICGDQFSNWIPRNGNIPLHSVSIVNFTEECALLGVSKKLDAVSILGMMVSVSSTYLR